MLTIQSSINRAKILVEALPYIQRFHGKTIVIKYGGSLMADDGLKAMFAHDIVLLKYVGINPIIVHGGGKEISKWMGKIGKDATFIDGLRFTDAETIELSEMVLSGKINSDVVSLINQNGGKAVGLSGKDASLFIAKKIRSETNQDLGFVGDIDQVDTTLLSLLCDQGYIPVLSSIATSKDGATLNMNADNAASAIAAALSATKLIYLTDVDGIKLEGKFQQQIPLKTAIDWHVHPDIQGGMKPKLACAVRALQDGVDRVHIINGQHEHAVLLELFTDNGIGSMLYADGPLESV